MKFKKYTNQYAVLAKEFTCGNIVIDNFLKSSHSMDANQGITYILLSDNEDFIIGYYNISVGCVDQVEFIGKNVYYVPMGGAVNINYLAVDVRLQHRQLAENMKIYFGDYLLRDCEKRICTLRKEIGIQFVTLCSTEEGYHMYHDRNSYEDFEEDMNNFVNDSDRGSYKLYKCVDDIIE